MTLRQIIGDWVGPLAIVTMALGCARDEARVEAPSTVAAPEPQHAVVEAAPTMASSPTTTTPMASGEHAYMTLHYEQALRMRLAVIRGDLPAFRAASSTIATHDIDAAAPPEWKLPAESMRLMAHRGSKAPSLEEAATVMGELGMRCASCHQTLGMPKLEVPELPLHSGVRGHMLRHQWAADRMWDGLITPSVLVWVRGAEALAEAPLTAEHVAPQTPEVELIARRVHFQANAARLLERKEWGRAYAEFVMSCSACHDKTGVTLRPAGEW